MKISCVFKSNEFKSLITIARDDRKVNAKSLLGVLSLGITKGTKVILTAEGPDEQESIDELNNLIMSNFTDIE